MILFITLLLWFFAVSILTVTIWMMAVTVRTKRTTAALRSITERVEHSNIQAFSAEGQAAWVEVYEQYACGDLNDREYAAACHAILDREGQ